MTTGETAASGPFFKDFALPDPCSLLCAGYLGSDITSSGISDADINLSDAVKFHLLL